MNELKEIFWRSLETEKERMKQEWALIKSLNGKSRRSHMLEYYKFHMFALALLVFFAGSGIYRIFNPPPDIVLSVAWMAGFESQANFDALKAGLAEVLVEDPSRQAVEILPFTPIGHPEADMAVQGRLAAMISSRDIDIVISEFNIENGEAVADAAPFWAFQSIRPLLEAAGVPDENVLYFVEEGWTPLPNAVLLQGSPLFELLEISTDERFLGVLSNTQREDAVLEALKVILGGS